jgi:colanic acid biosynthesis glycosyl transferase WcaI
MPIRPKILIYGMNFAPELTGIGRYTGELARGLAELRTRVDVITTPPHYPGWFVRPNYSAKTYRAERVEDISVVRCPLVLHKAGAGIWRLIAPLSFALTSAPVAAWRILKDRPAAVLCVEPTLFAAPVAVMAARLIGARTVLHIQDLEVDAAFAVGHLGRWPWLRWLGQTFDRFVTRRFDAIVTISEEMAKRIAAKGISPDRIHVIRNWVDTTRIRPLSGANRYRAELGLPEDAYVVLYSGQIGQKQALHVVFEAAERLAGRSNVHFVIAGEGPLKAAFAERYGQLPNVTMLGLQPEESLNEFLNLADCHILPQDPQVKDLVLPSKLGGMLASGRPVLIIADDDSELATFVGRSCIRVRPADIVDLPEMIAALAEGDANTGDEAARRALAETLNAAAAVASFREILITDAPMDKVSRRRDPLVKEPALPTGSTR